MGKELWELSLEELWERFPIFLVPHNDKWKLYYDEMEAFLKSILSEHPVERISHIGSTAVPGIPRQRPRSSENGQPKPEKCMQEDMSNFPYSESISTIQLPETHLSGGIFFLKGLQIPEDLPVVMDDSACAAFLVK